MAKSCSWPTGDPMMVIYHDEEWGVPLRDDVALFGKLLLDGFQAGLSWKTILHRRDAYIEVYGGWDPDAIARWTSARVAAVMKDERIIRNRQKIEASIKNARAYLALREQGVRFGEFLWQFTGGVPKLNRWRRLSQLPAESAESRAMSKALRERGFAFVGPTICYAFMQAVGMVNDHVVECARWREVQRLPGARAGTAKRARR